MREAESTFELYMYDDTKAKEAIDTDYQIDDAEVKEIDNGIILPMRIIEGTSAVHGDGLYEGGVCDENGAFIAGQHRHYHRQNYNRSCIQAYEYDSDDIKVVDETVIFGGILVRHWGHTLIDTTSRLWYPINNPDLPYKIVFILFPKQAFPYQELFDLAGISEDRYEIITEPTKFKRIIIPDEAFHSGSGHYRREWISFFDKVRSKVTPADYKKVYLTRTAFEIDNIVGEKYFEDFYRDMGYEVISPEKLTIKEQIEIAAGVDEIVTTMGTIADISLFSRPGTKLTILNRSRDFKTVVGMIPMNRIRKIQATYIDAHRNFLPEVQAGNCIVMLAPNKNWDSYIAEEFGEEKDKEFEENELPALVFECVKRWGDFFSERKSFRWIKNFTVKDIVENINESFNDKTVDTKDYLDSTEVVEMRRAIQDYRYEVMEYSKVEDLSGTESGFGVESFVAIPAAYYENCRDIEFRSDFLITNADNDQTVIKGKSMKQEYDPESEEVHLKGSFDMNVLAEELIKLTDENASVIDEIKPAICLVINDREKHIELYSKNKRYEVIRAGTNGHYRVNEMYLRLINEEDTLRIRLQSKKDYMVAHNVTRINYIHFNDSVIELKGTTVSGLVDTNEDCMSAKIQIYQEEPKYEETLPIDTVYSDENNVNQAEWKLSIDVKNLLQNEKCREDIKRWDPSVCVTFDGDKYPIRIGKGREPGMADVYRSFSFNDGMHYGKGVLTGMGNFSVLTGPLWKSLEKFRIEEVDNDSDHLYVGGLMIVGTLWSDDVAIKLALRNKKSKEVKTLSNIELNSDPDNNKRFEWKTEVEFRRITDIIATDPIEDREYELCIMLENDSDNCVIEIGNNRGKGIIKSLNTEELLFDGQRVRFSSGEDNDNIVIKTYTQRKRKHFGIRRKK